MSERIKILSGEGEASYNHLSYETARRDEFKWLRQGIWMYFILLIFEGALRKWVFPQLATPLLIVRDPIAVWLIAMSYRKGILAPNLYLTGMVILGVLSIFTGIFLGHGNLAVALFGARVFLLHFPLMFIIGKVFDRKDVISMGRVLLWLAIPMTVLIAMQFYSPQSAWVNKGIGDTTEGGGFSGAMGFFRPPATFSFITGTASFFSMVACFVFYFWLDSKNMNRLVLILATMSLMASIPLSISRTLFFGVGLTALFAAMAILRKPQYLGKMLVIIMVTFAIIFVFKDKAAIKTPLEAFTTRFTTANEQEGGIKNVAGDRFLGGMFEAIIGSSDQPFFGHGIGMGTNVGAMLLTGKNTFLISEGEWGRLIGEQGPILGLGVIILRLGFCFQLLMAAYRRLQAADILPWLLLSFTLINIGQGQWGQPSSLGFSILAGGMMLAVLRNSSSETS
jgi:hypothetical protein